MRVDGLSLGAVFLPPETLRPERGQPLAVLAEMDQGEAGAQPVVILFEPPVSHLVEAEDPPQYPERRFPFRSDSRLGCILAPGFFVHIVFEPGAAASHCACGAAARIVSPCP